MCARDLLGDISKMKVKRTHCRRLSLWPGIRGSLLEPSSQGTNQRQTADIFLVSEGQDRQSQQTCQAWRYYLASFDPHINTWTIDKSARNTNRRMGKGYEQKIHRSACVQRNAKRIHRKTWPCTHQSGYECLENRKVDYTERWQGYTGAKDPPEPLWGINPAQPLCQNNLQGLIEIKLCPRMVYVLDAKNYAYIK